MPVPLSLSKKTFVIKIRWTLHRPAYSTQYKLGASEYRYSFGELGSNPRDKLPAECTKQEKREDTLK
jgi:hypothetical protein